MGGIAILVLAVVVLMLVGAVAFGFFRNNSK